jgi:hypothetical protein
MILIFIDCFKRQLVVRSSEHLFQESAVSLLTKTQTRKWICCSFRKQKILEKQRGIKYLFEDARDL